MGHSLVRFEVLDYFLLRNNPMCLWLFFSELRNFTVQPIDAALSTKASATRPQARSTRPAACFFNLQGNLIMNRSTFSALALAVAALAATNAIAADASAPKTREQVKAELAEAVRTGDIVVNGETGQKANEMFPGLYPAKPEFQGKTREQVQAELAQAVRTGDILADGESGLMLNQINPSRYPAKPAAQSKTREQVKAELSEAIRTGDIVADGESGLKLNQLFPQRYNRNI
jgi:ribosomal protein L30E